MKVISVTIHRQRPVNGGFRVRASVTVEDNNLNQHTVDSNNTTFGPDADIETMLGEQVLIRLSDQEESRYLQKIRRGGNPFDPLKPPRFNSYMPLLRKTIRAIFSVRDPLDDLVFQGHKLLADITDDRLKQIFPNITDGKIAEMRGSASRIATARTELDSHVVVDV